MSSGVFVLRDERNLVPMSPAPFLKEDVFQDLLARFPTLLNGAVDSSGSARRWILVKREQGIPDQQGSADRWSVDHLFLDQDGVPTLVEVKRQSDSRLRREVVGQMLDYAANAVLNWSRDRIRLDFEATCAKNSAEPDQVVCETFGPEVDVESLWDSVKLNLQAGRVRLLFVADYIPPELRSIVEFLNKQMDPAEVLAIELRQFEGDGLRTIVPAVYGQTEEAQQRKVQGTGKRLWDEATFTAELERRLNPELVPSALHIVHWIKGNADQVIFGTGAVSGTMGAAIIRDGVRVIPYQLWTSGEIVLCFADMINAPFYNAAIEREWLSRLNSLPCYNLPAEVGRKYPTVKLSALEGKVREFLTIMRWLFDSLASSAAHESNSVGSL